MQLLHVCKGSIDAVSSASEFEQSAAEEHWKLLSKVLQELQAYNATGVLGLVRQAAALCHIIRLVMKHAAVRPTCSGASKQSRQQAMVAQLVKTVPDFAPNATLKSLYDDAQKGLGWVLSKVGDLGSGKRAPLCQAMVELSLVTESAQAIGLWKGIFK